MGRDEVIELLRAHRAEIDAFGVKSLALFGSVARDEARPDSDVDVLVEFEGPTTFRRRVGLLMYLEELLGRKVDLATPRMLTSRIVANVERDLLPVA
jgi:uncharacterized protein